MRYLRGHRGHDEPNLGPIYRQGTPQDGTAPAVEHDWELPERIVEKPGKHVWKHHLFANGQGEFAADLNGWEKAFMKWTQEQSDFVCWLRNLPRRDWAFCVPYEKAGEKPFYPDFVIVRKKGKAFGIVPMPVEFGEAGTDG